MRSVARLVAIEAVWVVVSRQNVIVASAAPEMRGYGAFAELCDADGVARAQTRSVWLSSVVSSGSESDDAYGDQSLTSVSAEARCDDWLGILLVASGSM